jgi:PAS domain S-box-containing protein
LPNPAPIPDFRILFESAPGLYVVLLPNDPLFTIVAVSDAYLAATMTGRDLILGRGIFQVFPDNPADPDASGVRNLHSSLSRVIANRNPDAMAIQRYDIQRPDSSGGGFEERFWSSVNSPVLDSALNVVYIIHRMEDVSDFVRLKDTRAQHDKLTENLRIRAEHMESEVFLHARQLQEANRLREQDSSRARDAVGKSERRYRTLVSATSSIVWTRDPGGTFIGEQPSWSAFTGQTREQYQGWGWLDAIHPQDRERVKEHWNEVLRTHRSSDIEARIWRVVTGTWCHYVGRSVPVTAPNGTIEEWIGTISDIDERKHLEEQLRHTTAPGTEAARAIHLTPQMLAYSDKGAFQIRELDLSELVRGISTLVQSSVPKTVHLRLELPEHLPLVEADSGQNVDEQYVRNFDPTAAVWDFPPYSELSEGMEALCASTARKATEPPSKCCFRQNRKALDQ